MPFAKALSSRHRPGRPAGAVSFIEKSREGRIRWMHPRNAPCSRSARHGHRLNQLRGCIRAGGGTYGHGVVFELSRSGGNWTETVLHSFNGGSDGGEPGGISLNRSTGYIYGNALNGGYQGGGTAYQLVLAGATFTVLHRFGGTGDLSHPNTAPVQDRTTGYLYGTAVSGGQNGSGGLYTIVQ